MTPGSGGAFHMPASAQSRSTPEVCADAQGEGHVLLVLHVREPLHLFVGDGRDLVRSHGDKRRVPVRCRLLENGKLPSLGREELRAHGRRPSEGQCDVRLRRSHDIEMVGAGVRDDAVGRSEEPGLAEPLEVRLEGHALDDDRAGRRNSWQSRRCAPARSHSAPKAGIRHTRKRRAGSCGRASPLSLRTS